MINQKIIKDENKVLGVLIDIKEYNEYKILKKEKEFKDALEKAESENEKIAELNDFKIAKERMENPGKTYTYEEILKEVEEEEKEEVIKTLKAAAKKRFGTVKNFFEAHEWTHKSTSLRNAFSIKHSRYPVLKEIADKLGYNLYQNISYELNKRND